MKILVLIHEFPPVGGGGGRVARDLALGLAARGHQLHILTAHMDGLPLMEDLKSVTTPYGTGVTTPYGTGVTTPYKTGAVVQRVGRQRKTAFRAELSEMLRFDLTVLRAGRQIIRDWQPDLIHAHFAVPAGAAAYALSKLTGVPYILTVHLGDVPGAVPEKTDRWFKWIFPFTPPIWRAAARVVAVSEFTRRLALQHYDVPIQVIPNGVELAALPSASPRLAGQGPRIVFAGRFMEQKNPSDLVQALVRLRDCPWQCAMLGDGPLLESVRREIADSGLAERFWLPGWVTPEHVLAEFARSDVLVLPSRSEGLSVVGVQALGMGLAMLMSSAGGNLELVQEGENGFIFPIGDVETLANRLSRLLENPSMLQFAQAKSREMAKKFDLAAIIPQYERIFAEVQTKPKP